MFTIRATRSLHGLLGTLLIGAGACGEAPSETVRGLRCDLDSDLLVSSLSPNAIPALNEPEMVTPGDPGAGYLIDSDRVLGVFVNGLARAYPHNILWHHEIVNDRIGDDWISVTFCPLTGSGLGFDPVVGGTRLDLGVSGLLYANNLVMYDRAGGTVYGPQLSVSGACESFRGRSLKLVPVQEMSWGRWKSLHPETTVVSGAQSFGRNYRVYPYGSYDEITDNSLLFSMSVDRTRPIKERVLAIREGSGGRGYPFGELAKLGQTATVNETVNGIPTVVFYDGIDGEVALAFDARVGGQTLTFTTTNDRWTDRETGSTWTLDGAATEGPLAGQRMAPLSAAYTLFWFAWRHFQPDGRVFDAP